jgi:uncharacterized protein (TIGR02246 family)
MKKIFLTATIIGVMMSCTRNQTTEANNDNNVKIENINNSEIDKEKVIEVVKNYFEGLNTTNVESILNLYNDNASFLMSEHEPMIGKDVLKEFYTGFFRNIKPNMKDSIVSVAVSGELAYVVSTSTGGGKMVVTGEELSGAAAQELFVLKKTTSGEWKIMVYHASSRIPMPSMAPKK